MEMRKSKLLVAVSLLSTLFAPAADPKHKQPMNRHERGKFVAFAYTSNNLTKEGKPPVPGLTIAADPEVLPLGSRVRINGAGPWSGEYRVGDIGGQIKGRKIDIYMQSVKEALLFGRREIEVVLLNPAPPRNNKTNTTVQTASILSSYAACYGCSAD